MVGKNKDNIAKLPVDQLIDHILSEAIKLQASYIHIEPSSDEIYVRCRVNGSLQDISRLPKKRFDSLLDRLKATSNMNTKERYIPQEGRFKFKAESSTYVMRVSILPTIEGEKIAINIMNDSNTAPNLNELGYWGDNLNLLTKSLASSKGLILLVGPGDSGKSTTLFSMLSNIKDPDIKIATIEDPVEYKISNANQIQVNQRLKLTFKSAIQSVLKHDTNVIMISELRSLPIINLSFSVASRGKLVITSFYGNNGPDTIEQLTNAGVSSAEIAHSLKIIISQKLVRRLCPNCKVAFEPDSRMLNLLQSIYDIHKPSDMSVIHGLEVKYANEKNTLKKVAAKDLSTTENRIKRLWKPSSDGCGDCFNSGYQSRMGVNEIFVNSAAVLKLISTGASKKALIDQAKNEGSISMMTDCLIKALQGETSIEEVIKLNMEFA